MTRHHHNNYTNDLYSNQAKLMGYAARSAFKLIEANQKHRLLKLGMHVLDLGCAPGSWCQYAAQQVGSQGQIIGIDLNPITTKMPPQVTCYQADITTDITPLLHPHAPFDVILSDLAPNTSGIPKADADRSHKLVETVLELTALWLKPQGTLFAKVFQGSHMPALYAKIRQCFQKTRTLKPKSSRPQSVEIFLLGLKWQGKL